jgi:hypothetical protein
LTFNLKPVRWFASLLLCSSAASGATGQSLSSDDWPSHAIVFVATTLVVVICVVLHYEILAIMSRWMRVIHLPPRRRILVLIFAILGAHVLEIWLFGAAYFGLTLDPGHGQLLAQHPMGILDCVYFSAVSFTTLGLGDITPVGPIRFMTGTEALCGFVLIAWSGSFTFVEMQRFWKD